MTGRDRASARPPATSRRTLASGIALAMLAPPAAALGQPARKAARIGILHSSDSTADVVGLAPRSASVRAFYAGMGDLGYAHGEHFAALARGAESRPDLFAPLAAELVGLRPDVIVAAGPLLAALKAATSTIPVVMTGSIDPVGQGFVQSLGRPGGNFTGMSLQLAETAAKRLELLKELVPAAALVAVIWDAASRLSWVAAVTAALERGWKLVPIELRDGDAIESAFKRAADAGAGALLVFAAGRLLRSAPRLAALAAAYRLPAMYELRLYAEAGGLIAYSADVLANWRRAAAFVDKLLKGARAADLPVEQPTKFELVLNMRAAKGMGLTIPPSILVRVDEVIE